MKKRLGMSRATPRVLIIGGGLGGLCLAQGLRAADCEVAVYERDATASARAQGYRISVDARGSGALRACLPSTLYQLFEATRGQPSTGVSRFIVEGTALKEVQTMRFPLTPVPGAPMAGYAVDRLTLRETLLAGIQPLVHFGKEFTRYELLPGGRVRAHFADGTAEDGEVLVAADGVGSRVRQQHLPYLTLIDTGARWLGGRTVLDDRLLTLLPEALSDRAVWITDRGHDLFLASVLFQHVPDRVSEGYWPGLRYTDGESFLMWAFVGRRDRFLAPDRQLAAASALELHRLAVSAIGNGHPLLRAIVEAASAERSFFLAIRAVGPVDRWPSGPVTYVGDAIHAGPINGTGANAALEDAALFCRHVLPAFDGGAALGSAIRDYDAEMLSNARARQAGIDALRASIPVTPPGRL
jgi:2-polyprenyl-6-methoxyphenol hydroxylase-like FAD-dependent oxidoreductase